MKRFTKVSAGLLLTLGFLLLMVPVAVLSRKEATSQDKLDAIGGFVLGLPTVAWGGWLARGLYRQRQQEASDRLHCVFYRLLTEGNGKITVMRFALEAQLSAAVAKQYLDDKAQEFDADFGVSEEGGIFYYFIL